MIKDEYCECKFSNNNNNEYLGIFSFDHHTGGILKIHSESLNYFQFAKNDGGLKTIYGVTRSGKKFTIVNPFNTGYKSGHKSEMTFEFSHLLFGVATTNVDDILVSNIFLDLDWVDFWIKGNGFNLHDDKAGNFSLDYRIPESIQLYKDSQKSIEITYSINRSFGGMYKKISFKQTKRLSVKLEKKLSLTDSKIITHKLAVLIGIITYRYPPLKSIDFKMEDGTKITLHNETDVKDEVDSGIYPVKFDYFLNASGKVISRWFEIYNDSAHIIEIILTFLNGRNEKQINRFLDLCKGLESFSALYYDFEIISKKEFREMRSRIKGAVSEDDYKFIEQSIAFANNPTLYQRLMDLYSKHKGVLFEKIGWEEVLIKKVKATRNYYTHYSNKKGILELSEIHYVSIKMHYVLMYMLFHTLGFKRDDLEESMESFFKMRLNYTM